MIKGNILEAAISFVVLSVANASNPESVVYEHMPSFFDFSALLNGLEQHLTNWGTLIVLLSVAYMNYKSAKKSESETKANERKDTYEAIKTSILKEIEKFRNGSKDKKE